MQAVNYHIVESSLFGSEWSAVQNGLEMLHYQKTIVYLVTAMCYHRHELVRIIWFFAVDNFVSYIVELQDASNLGGRRRGSKSVNDHPR